MTGKEEYSVRDYRRGDYTRISEIWQSTGMGNPSRGDNEETIEDSIDMGGRLLLLEEIHSGLVVGTSWMTFDGRRIHLHHFGIDPLYQGKGLSHILLKNSLSHVKSKGYQVKLEVHSSNSRAIDLYRKHGFEYLGDYNVYIIRNLDAIGG
ncbi:MAG: GNAT family N-acetyltransferase [Bacteroidales bacterium]